MELFHCPRGSKVLFVVVKLDLFIFFGGVGNKICSSFRSEDQKVSAESEISSGWRRSEKPADFCLTLSFKIIYPHSQTQDRKSGLFGVKMLVRQPGQSAHCQNRSDNQDKHLCFNNGGL